MNGSFATANELRGAVQGLVSGGLRRSAAGGLNYLTGNLWTARQRQGHSLHEISYRACFKPQLAEFFINLLTAEQEIVLDPFMGRGTTAIQAALMNRTAYGSDVNPLSVMLAEPRLCAPSPAAVEARLRQIPPTGRVKQADRALEVFFHPQVLRRLAAMKNWFIKRAACGQLDETDKWIRMVAINRLTGHSPGFFSVKTMPPNQAVSLKTQQRFNAVYGRLPECKDVNELIIKKSRQLLRSGVIKGSRKNKLMCAPAFNLSYIKPQTVSAIVTSPPFLDTVDYYKDNWLRCWFAGIRQEDMKIDLHRNAEAWKQFIYRCFQAFYTAVKPGGYVAFEVGEARKGMLLLEQLVAQAVAPLPFSILTVLVNQQQFTKTANCWGVRNNENGTNTNRIVLLQRQ